MREAKRRDAGWLLNNDVIVKASYCCIYLTNLQPYELNVGRLC